MITKPRISIVLPVFNSEEYLEMLLTSLFTQTEQSIEIIAVDDGSTDNSLAILRLNAEKDCRLFVLDQPNQGVGAARNHGLKYAKGEWVVFVDSDDWLHPATFNSWCSYAEAENLDVLIGNGFRFKISPDGTMPLLQNQLWQKVMSGVDWLVHCTDVEEWPHHVWLQLVRRDLLIQEQLSFDETLLHEDILWTLQLALKARRVGFFSAPFYGYRIHSQSITNNDSEQVLELRARSYIPIIQEFAKMAHVKRKNPSLRLALLRQSNRESGHFFGLIKKRLRDPYMRKRLASEFIRLGLMRSVFQGATNKNEFWRAVKCCGILQRCASYDGQECNDL